MLVPAKRSLALALACVCARVGWLPLFIEALATSHTRRQAVVCLLCADIRWCTIVSVHDQYCPPPSAQCLAHVCAPPERCALRVWWLYRWYLLAQHELQ